MSSWLSFSMASKISVKSRMKSSFQSFFAYWASQNPHFLLSPLSWMLYFHFLNSNHLLTERLTYMCNLLAILICRECYVWKLYWVHSLWQIKMFLTITWNHELWYKHWCPNDIISQHIVDCIITYIQPIDLFNK